MNVFEVFIRFCLKVGFCCRDKVLFQTKCVFCVMPSQCTIINGKFDTRRPFSCSSTDGRSLFNTSPRVLGCTCQHTVNISWTTSTGIYHNQLRDPLFFFKEADHLLFVGRLTQAFTKHGGQKTKSCRKYQRPGR